MSGSVFVDTNVLIYAHDADAGPKHEVAAASIRELWSSRRGVLSTQVLQEFYVNVTRKIASPLPRAEAREVITTYGVWPMIEVNVADVVRASEIEERYQLSFWDGLIVAAAEKGGAEILLTEDLSQGQRFGGVVVKNPFS